jgi:hypothetical protein
MLERIGEIGRRDMVDFAVYSKHFVVPVLVCNDENKCMKFNEGSGQRTSECELAN